MIKYKENRKICKNKKNSLFIIVNDLKFESIYFGVKVIEWKINNKREIGK